MKLKNIVERDKELPEDFFEDHIMNYPIVFVFMGTKLPKYIIPSLRLNRKFSPNADIYFVSNLRLGKEIEGINEVDVVTFYKSSVSSFFSSPKKSKWWDGFWNKTIERFFVLESFMREYNFNSIIHMEIDNLGFDLGRMSELICETSNGLYYPTYQNKYSAASILFINGISSIAHFNKFISMSLDKNDMTLLYEYRSFEGNYAMDLPVDFKNNNYKSLGIFDLNAIGFYLFGTDKRILKKLNRNLLITNQEIFNDLIEPISEFLIEKDRLYLKINEQKIKLNNVHVHSKIQKKLTRPKFMNFILNAASMRRSIVIEINFCNIIKNHIIEVALRVKKFIRIFVI